MKVLIEATGTDRVGGGRSVMLGLFSALFDMDRNTTYQLLVTQPEPAFASFPNVRQISFPTRDRFLARVDLQRRLPGWIRRERVDVVHFTKNLGLFGLPCPSVITVHDLTIRRYPEMFPQIDGLYWRLIQPFTLRSAAAIVTVSEDARRDVIRYYHVAPDRVRVAYNACAPEFVPQPPGRVAEVRTKYGLPEHYIVHVGSISPKKNLETLIAAYAQLRRSGVVPHSLVLVGRDYFPGARAPLVEQVARLGIQQDVIFTGPIPDADLPGVYAGAELFAMPSLHEGFGVVLVEAMQCRTPIVATRCGAIPEVAEGVGILVDHPTDPSEMASAIQRVLTDSTLSGQMIAAGVRRAAEFSWAKSAARYIGVYHDVAERFASARGRDRVPHAKLD